MRSLYLVCHKPVVDHWSKSCQCDLPGTMCLFCHCSDKWQFLSNGRLRKNWRAWCDNKTPCISSLKDTSEPVASVNITGNSVIKTLRLFEIISYCRSAVKSLLQGCKTSLKGCSDNWTLRLWFCVAVSILAVSRHGSPSRSKKTVRKVNCLSLFVCIMSEEMLVCSRECTTAKRSCFAFINLKINPSQTKNDHLYNQCTKFPKQYCFIQGSLASSVVLLLHATC